MATQERKTIAFVLYPGITLLDMVGPLQVFSLLRDFNNQYQPVIVAERLEPMVTDTPLTVTADKTLAEVPHPTVVIVPGGGPPTIRAMGDEAIGTTCARSPARRMWSPEERTGSRRPGRSGGHELVLAPPAQHAAPMLAAANPVPTTMPKRRAVAVPVKD